MDSRVPERKEIAIEYTWNAPSVFPSDAAWESEFVQVSGSIAGLDRFKGHLADGPEALAACLAARDEMGRRVGKLSVYANMSHSVDMTDQEATDRYSRMMGLHSRFFTAVAFIEPELLAIPTQTLQDWMRREPALAVYAHYFDSLDRRKAHIRSVEVEELLGQASSPFGTARTIHGVLANADMTFPPARDSAGKELDLTQGTVNALLHSADPATRRSAYEQYADAFLTVKNTAAACLEAGIKQNVFQARARRYDSALQAALEGRDIPMEVFHNLIATYKANLPTWHRYWDLRRRALGVDRLPVRDSRAPLTDQQSNVPYAQAVEWICAGMQPLGEEYVQTLRRGVQAERWVDVYPNRGKRMGAFSSGAPGTYPFILMSYNDDLFSLSTLAHELGHSLHSYYTTHTQPFIYARYGMFVAEVASNFNQALVRAHLLSTQSDRDFQIAVLEEAMANFHRYFFVMPNLARFEREIHERVERGEALTAETLNTLMADLFREGFGPAVEVDADRVGITWAQFPTHLYANFYVYQYATGISGAHALAQGVLEEGEAAARRYIEFLKAGGSLYPLDALKLAGCDLASPEPVERTFAVMASYVDRLEQLLK